MDRARNRSLSAFRFPVSHAASLEMVWRGRGGAGGGRGRGVHARSREDDDDDTEVRLGLGVGRQGQGSTASSGLPQQNLSNQSPCQGQVAEPRAAGAWVGCRYQELGDRENTQRLLLGLPAKQTLSQGQDGFSQLSHSFPRDQAQVGLPSLLSPSGTRACPLFFLLWTLNISAISATGQETKELIWET